MSLGNSAMNLFLVKGGRKPLGSRKSFVPLGRFAAGCPVEELMGHSFCCFGDQGAETS